MSNTLTNFSVKGLHGRGTTVNIPFIDNKLVLVGENGAGKSTIANLIYYSLTRQWRRLLDYQFDEIIISTTTDTVFFSHDTIAKFDDFTQASNLAGQLRGVYPISVIKSVQQLVFEDPLLFEQGDLKIATERLTERARIHPHVAERILFSLQKGNSKLKKNLLQQLNKINSWNFGQFLYLPTYRRIEQDLKSIFRGIEIEEKVRQFRERFRKRDKSSYIELVEFGMEDVEATIQFRMAQIKESVRTGLSNLTGNYLREVIRGLQENPEISIFQSIDLIGFQSMFARIDEAILPANDKILLQNKIVDFATGAKVGENDKVIAHFLSKLVTLYQEQKNSEIDVRDFIKLCNQYLGGKKFIYDDVKYEIFIQQGDLIHASPDPQKLSLRDLSSGEKQIVSLFSHIYFSGESNFFVIIDEPELSLSVPWQQRFLVDIIDTGRCSGMLAVTHSPFIWENSLENAVKSLAECITSYDPS